MLVGKLKFTRPTTQIASLTSKAGLYIITRHARDGSLVEKSYAGQAGDIRARLSDKDHEGKLCARTRLRPGEFLAYSTYETRGTETQRKNLETAVIKYLNPPCNTVHVSR